MKRVDLVVPILAAYASQAQGQGVQIPLNQFYGGGLTILAHNDLVNNPANGSAAVLVHQPANYPEVKTSCQLLNETLWNPDEGSFTDGLNSSLSYQIHQDVFPKTQLFWVAQNETDPTACRAIDATGEVYKVDCITSRLPALCSQSAPVLTSRTNNEPTRFVVNQQAEGDLVYQGFRDHFAWKFRGVRYAAPPTRFEHSKTPYQFSADERSKPIPALNATGDCLQRVGEVQSGSTEDCLFLNIWTPYLPPLAGAASSVPKPKTLKPVMFYIYGGGFTSGSWKNPNTDGTMLASRGDVVVVSVNYRVGAPGWLVFDDGVHKGNYGLGDLVTALQWVGANIGYFGGDRNRVTIFGESAGAMLVRALLASPKAKGLFYAAISQSGPTGLADNEGGISAKYDSIQHAFSTVTTPLLSKLGCGNTTDQSPVDCVRRVNGTDLIAADPVARGLVVDNDFLVSDALALNTKNSSFYPSYTADVVFMTGTNRDELGIDFDMPAKDANLTSIISNLLPPNRRSNLLPAILASPAFAIPEKPTPEQMLAAEIRVATDAVYTCLEHATVFSASRPGNTAAFKSLYSFQFNRTYNPSGYTKPHCDSPSPERAEYYKCHAGEQMIVFATVARGGLPDRDGRDLPFVRAVVDQWAAFAAARDPNPSREYLVARGYWSTLAHMEAAGPWMPASSGGGTTNDDGDDARPVRLLQAESRMTGWTERAQCDVLGLPLDYFERDS